MRTIIIEHSMRIFYLGNCSPTDDDSTIGAEVLWHGPSLAIYNDNDPEVARDTQQTARLQPTERTRDRAVENYS